MSGTERPRPVEPPRPVDSTNWQDPDLIHWSFSHVDQILPTATIDRGREIAPLPPAPVDLSELPVTVPYGGPTTVGEVIATTNTDAWLVLHHGRILAEHYAGSTTPGSRHLLQSVSKTLVGGVVGALVGRGLIDTARPVSTYAADLVDCPYGTATVRQVLDMRSGLGFREDYDDPLSDSRVLEAITGWAPLPPGVPPSTLRSFLRSLPQVRPHGGAFDYRSCETDVLGLVCEGATGSPFPQLAAEVLWSVLGVEADALICLDSAGTGVFDGGLGVTLRDLARFGFMIISGGVSLTGEQVLPAGWVEDSFVGGPDSTAAFAATAAANLMPGGRYRNQLWLPSADRDVALALGIHGQLLYLDRRSGLVGVKLSSWPEPSNPAKSSAAVAAFAAIGRWLTT